MLSELKNSLPNEKEFFLRSFRDLKFLEKILPRIFGSWTGEKGLYHSKWATDDYPEFEMLVYKSDGSIIEIASTRQTLFMFENPKLGKAIAALLPKKFTNRERLNGDFLAYEIAREVYKEIEEDLNRLETQNRIGNELARLAGKFTIRKTDINYVSSLDVGRLKSEKHWWKSPEFPSWKAELRRNDAPQNVIIGVSLPFKENKLAGFDVFQSRIDGIIKHALSVPWLAEAVAEDLETEFEIRFVEDRSFSKKAQESFLEDLKIFGENALDLKIRNDLEKSVFWKSPKTTAALVALADFARQKNDSLAN